MKTNYSMRWLVEGVCDMGCKFYRDGFVGKDLEKPVHNGEHCRFKGKGDTACGANARFKEEKQKEG